MNVPAARTQDAKPAPPGRRRRRRAVLAAAVVAAAALAVLLALFDWNWFKRPVERAVSARLDREFRIGGDLDVDLGRIVTVRGERLSLANAAWSQQRRMAAAERAEIDIAFWPLLLWRVRIPEIRLVRPDLLLETGPDGAPGNWAFREGRGGEPPAIRRLYIEAGRLRFVDAPRETGIDLRLDSADRRRPDAAPGVGVTGGGHWRGNPFTLEGRTESPLELATADRPYRVDLRGAAGATRAHVRGTLTNPFQFRSFDLQMRLEGRDMEDLFPLIGIAIPPTPPYRLDGRFIREDELWKYEGFTGRVGDSDLAGSAQVQAGGERPYLRANLASKRLDFDDLAGFVGGTPRTDGDGQAAAARPGGGADGRVLPDTPYNLAKLRAMDADVRLQAQRVDAPKLPLQDMQAHLLLENGLLRLEPLNFGVADGDIRADVRMDARTGTLRTTARGTVRGVQLGKLFPDARLAQEAVGRIGGDIDLGGEGNSIARMLGSADGEVAIGMGRGRIGNLVMELAGLDIAESLKYLLTRDRQIPIRCAFGDFAVEDGVMRARALAFDTTDTLLVGEGSVSLKDERLDLLIRPRPKDVSILSLRSPLRIGGSFADPSFRPDMKALGLRGALALSLASIAPPAALLATFETGPGEDAECGGQYAR